MTSPDSLELSLGCGAWQPIEWREYSEEFVELGADKDKVGENLGKVQHLSNAVRKLLGDHPELAGQRSYVSVRELEEDVCPGCSISTA